MQDPFGSSSEDTDQASDYTAIPCLWLFLPLQHPLGLPHGWQSVEPLSPPELLENAEATTGLRTSLLIHQMEPSYNQLLVDSSDLMAYAVSAVKESHYHIDIHRLDRYVQETGADLAALKAVRTVAEVAVPGLSESEADVVKAIDLAIGHVRFVQHCVAVATQEAIQLLTRARLPPTIPIFAGKIEVNPSVSDSSVVNRPTFERSLHYHIEGSARPIVFGIYGTPYDKHALATIASVITSGGQGVFHQYADIRREAWVQRYIEGNNRHTLLNLATAGEVLLDAMLLHMLWEEHASPKYAADVFSRSEGHASRIRREFPKRIGGSWNRNSTSAAGQYQRYLVELRHRVVHAGHDPSVAELDRAADALVELEHYLGDRFCTGPNLKKYTRTAVNWMGEGGLQRRGAFTKYVRKVLSSDEPDWADTFRRWRSHVDRALGGDDAVPGSGDEFLMVYAEKLLDGSVRWILHDRERALAAIADPQTVSSDEQIEIAERWLDRLEGEEIAGRRVGSVLKRPVPQVAWQPDHEVFPEFRLFAGSPAPAPS